MRALRMRVAGALGGLVLAPVLALAMGAAAAAQDDPRLERSVLRPDPTAVVASRTGSFAGADGKPAAYDIYYAPGQSGPRPVLVLVSGTEDARDWGFYRDMAKLAVARGFVAVIPNKRFPRGGGGIADGRADTLAFLAQLAANEPALADRARTCLWGFSGGGTTLSIAWGSEQTKLACAIGHYPAARISQADPASPWALIHSPAAAAGARASPASPPVLIVRAGLDTADLNAGIVALVEALATRNAPLEFVNLPDARHGFDLLDDVDWSRAAIEASFAFAARHTRAKAED